MNTKNLYLILALLLAACASSTAGLSPLGAALQCDAEADQICTRDGCKPANEGVRLSVPLAVSLRANDGPGQICMATGCGPASFERAPTPAGAGWAGRAVSSERGQGGLMVVSADRRTFKFIVEDPEDDDAPRTEWSGYCQAPGS